MKFAQKVKKLKKENKGKIVLVRCADIRTQLLKVRKREGLKMKKTGKECRKNVKIL